MNFRTLSFVVSATFALTGVVTTFLGPILPALAARWRLSDSQSGYFFAVQFLGSIAGVGISTVFVRWRGYRFTIMSAYFLMAVGVMGLTATQWKLALLGTSVFGLGFGVAIPASNLLISALNPERRAAALSILNFCWGVGAVVAPAGLAAAQRANHTQWFMPTLSGLLVLAAMTMSLTPEDRPHMESAHGDGTAVATSRALLALAAMFFLYVAVESSVGGWIATLAQRAPMGADQPWLLAPAVFWAGLLAGRAAAPMVLRHSSERGLAMHGLAAASAGILTLALARHRQWITIVGGIIGLGLAAVFPITVAALSRFPGSEKRIAGPMFALAGLGGALMPWLVGEVSTRSGSLQMGFAAPLAATVVLFWLHTYGLRDEFGA